MNYVSVLMFLVPTGALLRGARKGGSDREGREEVERKVAS